MCKVHTKSVVNLSLVVKLPLTTACSTQYSIPVYHSNTYSIYILKLFYQISPLGFNISFMKDSITQTSCAISLLSDELGNFLKPIYILIYCNISLLS